MRVARPKHMLSPFSAALFNRRFFAEAAYSRSGRHSDISWLDDGGSDSRGSFRGRGDRDRDDRRPRSFGGRSSGGSFDRRGGGGFGRGGPRAGFERGSGFGGGKGGMQKLDPIDWSGIELKPFPKNFYKPHDQVVNLPKAEIDEYMKEHQIKFLGGKMPNPVFKFDYLDFHPVIKSKIAESGFKSPTPIQAIGWPLALSGSDMIGIARTGSGKTLSFLLPALLHIDAQPPLQPTDGPIALILCPTRELADQIYSETMKIVGGTAFKVAAVYGGANKGQQLRSMRNGVHLMIATPGRLIDLLSSGLTNLHRVTYFVLDEADRMMDMGFEPQIRSISNQIRPDRQTLFWSATWPIEVQKIANSFTSKDAARIVVGSTELSVNTDVTQEVIVCSGRRKLSKMEQIYKENADKKILVFTRTKRGADDVSEIFYRWGANSDAIHGDKSQDRRNYVLNSFRSSKIKVLVATDVAARGIDVKDVDIVINYDFPEQIEDYVHRVGRTGRAGRKGIAYTFFCENDAKSRGLAARLIDLIKKGKSEVPEALVKVSKGHFNVFY